MISYSTLGKVGSGRLGNSLFQIASCIGLAETFKTDVSFPEWKYELYFKNPLPKLGSFGKPIKETHFHYDLNQFNHHCDITGWLQSEKYFEHCKEYVREQFEFKDSFKAQVRRRFKVFDKQTIAISIRRGDYVNNPNYALLPISYYINALTYFFHGRGLKADWRDYNILIFSDDIPYCKVHFSCLPNVYFADGNDIEQLCLMSMCDNFIIANSTFSYWGAWLGEKKDSIIVKPNYHFGYEFGLKNNAKDFYPERWKGFDHKGKRLDLSDTTFVIPVSYDHPDRKQNLDLAIKNLQTNFDCRIIVGEQGSDMFSYVDCIYTKFVGMEKFHRTKMLNVMSNLAGTPIVINYDADVLIPPMQILDAVNRIRKGADFVYPYDGRFARVPRLWYESVESHNDVGIFANEKFKGTLDEDMRSFGGCIAYNRNSFFEAGGENENFISYSPEDWERVYRFRELGYKVERVDGILYHIDHWCGVDSSTSNPHHNEGMIELKRIQKLKGEALRREVDSWATCNKNKKDVSFADSYSAIK